MRLLLLFPLRFKLGGCQVAQGRMNALMGVDTIDEMAELAPGIGKVIVFGQLDFLLFEDADQAFCIAILRLD